MTDNHCGVVQILFSDGHVEVRTSVKLPGSEDDMFHNLEGDVDLGLTSDDAVLGPSEAAPKVFFLKPLQRQSDLGLPR
jgi:prepilin-type processing-associated H-X9-DG protein